MIHTKMWVAVHLALMQMQSDLRGARLFAEMRAQGRMK